MTAEQMVKRILQLAGLHCRLHRQPIKVNDRIRVVRVYGNLGHWSISLRHLYRSNREPLLMKAKAHHVYQGDAPVFSYRRELSEERVGLTYRIEKAKINVFNGQVPELLKDIEKFTALDQLAIL